MHVLNAAQKKHNVLKCTKSDRFSVEVERFNSCLFALFSFLFNLCFNLIRAMYILEEKKKRFKLSEDHVFVWLIFENEKVMLA